MGRGRAKSTSLGVIRWTVKAILCSAALIALVIGYSILGAFLFQAIENGLSEHNAQQSLESRTAYLASLEDYVQAMCDEIDRLQAQARDLAEGNDTDTTPQTSTAAYTLPDICNDNQTLDRSLRDYEGNLTVQLGWRFTFRDDSRDKWTFAQALLFSVTVMTTIGYGNLVPKTQWGRVATMVYAMFGIPLMLLCLAYIGNIWANVLRLVYTAFYRCCRRCNSKPTRTKTDAKKEQGREMQPTADKTAKSKAPKGEKAETVKSRAERIASVAPEVANEPKGEKSEIVASKSDEVVPTYGANGSLDAETAQPEVEEEEVPVPAWLAALILVSYLAGGAVLFHYWEQWNYLDSSYFCFITFSTIGFGDFVPGDSTVSGDDPKRAALCAFYILFGLATMSMVISVIQEDVIRVVYKIGKKVGITKATKRS